MTDTFKVNFSTKAATMMQALLGGEGKTDDDIGNRCKELCGLIDDTAKQHPDWNPAQILEHSINHHAKNQNEAIFLAYILGTEIGEATEHIKQHLGDLFSRLSGRMSGPFVFSHPN